MTTKLTLFTATLVQDSALSVSGLDRETSADQPFTLINGVPTLVGRGLKGAAVAMARRFFVPFPAAVSAGLPAASDQPRREDFRRSVWEFSNATPLDWRGPGLRAGVGIRQKTGARAGGVLYDREISPAGTRWQLSFRVDRSQALNDDEFTAAEGILGYVLADHWAKGRCWLGGGAARGLGWCHVDKLKAYRFNEADYETWVRSDRKLLPEMLETVPTASPTSSWCFRTLDLNISFGEYTPEPNEAAWGLDMLAVGPHDTERSVQPKGDGQWARPAWSLDSEVLDVLSTDRAMLMDGVKGHERPLLPGSSVRGPVRHAFSRLQRAADAAGEVRDPHLGQGKVGEDDAEKAFGTVSRSSRILIRDACAAGEWAAAKLHMHAEDEFSAGSYGNAKRDAVRLLKGTFPVRIVVEGATAAEVEPLVKLIERQVALGELGHLLIGGHKTRGAGAGQWQLLPSDDVLEREQTPTALTQEQPTQENKDGSKEQAARVVQPRPFIERPDAVAAWIRWNTGTLTESLTLGAAATLARSALGQPLVAWWCEPTIDLDLQTPPATFGRAWPDEGDPLKVDELAFYAERAVWRAARTSSGTHFVLIEELDSEAKGAKLAQVTHTPARLHEFRRFSSAKTGKGDVLLREWHLGEEILGFTLAKEEG